MSFGENIEQYVYIKYMVFDYRLTERILDLYSQKIGGAV